MPSLIKRHSLFLDVSSFQIIRSIKFKESQQSAKLYYVPDLEDLMLKLSAGYTPQLKHGRVKP